MGATEAVQLVNECVKLGGLAFPQAAEAANLFNAVGLIFLATMNLAPGSPNYNKILHEDMQQLKLGVTKLHQEMRKGFKGVESLIVEHSFTKDIIHKVENQERFLDNLLSARSNASLDQFIHECELNRPQTLLSNIIGFIKHDVTNPIKYTMNASPLESKAILKQWRKKIQNLAGSLAMIHGMYLGVSYYQKYLKDDGTMKKNIEELETVLMEFEKNFKLKYWDSITTLVESTMDSRTDLWNDAKADLLKDALNGMYTNDQFYIIVYDEVAGHDHHSFLYDGDKTLVRYRRGGCNVIVYASETAYKTSNKDYDWLKGKVESWRDGYIPNHNSLETITQKISDNINWQGFVGLIRAEHNPIIRSTGKDWKWGPGWWITANGPNQIIPKIRAAGVFAPHRLTQLAPVDYGDCESALCLTYFSIMSTPLPGHMPGAEQVQYRIPGGQITFPPSYSSIPFQPITTQPGIIPTEQFGSPFGLQGPEPAGNIPYGLEYLSTLDTIIVYRDRRVWVCDPIKHSIRNANQEQIFYTMCQLHPETPYYNGSACAAVLHMGDNFQRQVLTMKVPYICCGYDLEAAMECPPGQIRGRFLASHGCSTLDVAINDINGNPILSVVGSGTCTAREYQIIGMNGVQIGSVTWIGLWAAEWIIKCPVNLDVNMKASLICSVFLLDYCIQQRNNRSR